MINVYTNCKSHETLVSSLLVVLTTDSRALTTLLSLLATHQLISDVKGEQCKPGIMK